MLMWWLCFCLVVFRPLCVRASEPGSDYEEDILEEADILEALQKIIDFLASDMDKVNIDGLLGTIIAEAQLNLVIQKISLGCILFDKVIDLQNKLHIINKHLKRKLKTSSEMYKEFYKSLLKTSVWELEHNFDKSTIYLPAYNWTNISFQEIMEKFVYNGPPDGEQSENCILELSKGHTENEKHDCIPSPECIRIMAPMNSSNGYPLTHKLLYIQIARALQCRINEYVVEEKIKMLCSRIFQEYRSIDNMPYKNALLQDLYLEQMVLCGLEGYTEFLPPASRYMLLDWQTEHGCYGDENEVLSIENPRWRVKRFTAYMKFGCESHITGLASAALAVHLNYLVSTSTFEEGEIDDEMEDFSNILLFT